MDLFSVPGRVAQSVGHLTRKSEDLGSKNIYVNKNVHPQTAGLHSAVGRAPDSCQRSWVRYPVWPHTFVSPSADSTGAVVSYRRKYVHEVLVNRLGGLSLPRKSVFKLTDRPDMILDVYRGRKTTTQHNNHKPESNLKCVISFCSVCLAFFSLKLNKVIFEANRLIDHPACIVAVTATDTAITYNFRGPNILLIIRGPIIGNCHRMAR